MILNALLLTCSTALLIVAITLLHRARKHANETIRLLTARDTLQVRHNTNAVDGLADLLKTFRAYERRHLEQQGQRINGKHE